MVDQSKVEEITTVERAAPSQVVRKVTTVAPPSVQTELPQKAYEKKKTIFRTYQVIWYILGVIEILLTFRVLLKMLGANINSAFVSLIYIITDPLAVPFNGIFGVSINQIGALFEWSTLVAMAVYALIAYGLIQLMQLIKPTTPQEVEKEVDSK